MHSCALTSANTVQCWGQNTEGQLGNGSTTNASSPVTVSGLTHGYLGCHRAVSQLRGCQRQHGPLLGSEQSRPARQWLDHQCHLAGDGGGPLHLPPQSRPATTTLARSPRPISRNASAAISAASLATATPRPRPASSRSSRIRQRRTFRPPASLPVSISSPPLMPARRSILLQPRQICRWAYGRRRRSASPSQVT